MTTAIAFRNSIKAVIIREGMLLVTRNQDPLGEFLLLPGGGQQFGETMIEALQRECREELGAEIVVGDLLGIREYIGSHHEFAEYDAHVHQVEIMFRCDLPPGQDPDLESAHDQWQTGVAWVPLSELDQHRIYPQALREWLPTLPEPDQRYLGDVN